MRGGDSNSDSTLVIAKQARILITTGKLLSKYIFLNYTEIF